MFFYLPKIFSGDKKQSDQGRNSTTTGQGKTVTVNLPADVKVKTNKSNGAIWYMSGSTGGKNFQFVLRADGKTKRVSVGSEIKDTEKDVVLKALSASPSK